MNQYKPLFLGTCDPSDSMYGMKRACNSQKCIRAGGKHNDLDDVGKDVYHHTYFEMLGNWSFGDYFKEEAISWGFECLTTVYGLDPNRLYATYFGGDKDEGLEPDLVAKAIWERFLPANRVLPFGCADNFWEMGNTGPCGPCSEIHYDRIGNRDASTLVNADLPDVIEIWNIVFIQYNRENDRSLKDLPAKHVDTGMGFERLSSILQGVDSNYDTDIFIPIFDAIRKLTNAAQYGGKVGEADKDYVDMAYRVVADHIRALTFAITDGAVPASDGRGYVLRRILRRAVRYGQEILGAPAGFFTQLTPLVVNAFQDIYPELKSSQAYVMSILSEEEQSFNRTLDHGVRHFKKIVTLLKNENKNVLSASDCHLLFTSMGFPLDLTELMAEERGLTIDKVGFQKLMEKERKLSVAAELARRGGSTKDMTMAAEQTVYLTDTKVNPTNSDYKYIWNEEHNSNIVAIYNGKTASVLENAGFLSTVNTPTVADTDDVVGLILDTTSYYYESGGQIYDTGTIVIDSGVNNPNTIVFNVVNVQTYAGFVLHVGTFSSTITPIPVKVGDKATCHVDYDRRLDVAANHTMTHGLNFGLRQVLCDDTTGRVVDQKGSLVDEDKLRFDFSWSKALTPKEVKDVENIVNTIIDQKEEVYAQVVPLSEASKISSIRAVFGERYPDPVRVLSIGADINQVLGNPDGKEWISKSIEFCGGTHLSNTTDAKSLVIIEENGIAKGIRRIVAYTRDAAKKATLLSNLLIDKLDRYKQESLKFSSNNNVNLYDSDILKEYKILTEELKQIKQEIDQSAISLVTKSELRVTFDSIQDTLRSFNKQITTHNQNKALELIDSWVKNVNIPENFDGAIIGPIDINADGKIASTIIKKFKSSLPSASLFFLSSDISCTRFALFSHVADNHVKNNGVNGKEWCIQSANSTGVATAKGGGKPNGGNANVPLSGSDSDRVNDITNAIYTTASDYIVSKDVKMINTYVL